jgi:DNA-binding GntR family transcriptional regulator
MEQMVFRAKSDVIAAALRELIITGELEPGTPLRQRELAVRFGVSPTPVREALSRLDSEGLVQHDLHRGAIVVEGTADADEEGYQVRAVLEALAARSAALRVTPRELDRLRALHDEFCAAPADSPALPDINRRFHFAIYEASGSPVLLALLRLLWHSLRQSPQVMSPQRESVQQHGAILEALRSHDADEAERLTRDHVLSALDWFLASTRPAISA